MKTTKQTTDIVIDALIEAWHTGDSDIPLHEYLGLTWQEYLDWLKTGKLPEK